MPRSFLHISFVAFLAAAAGCHLINGLNDNCYGADCPTGAGGSGQGAGGSSSSSITNNGGGGTGQGGDGGMGMCTPACGECDFCTTDNVCVTAPGQDCTSVMAGKCDSAGVCVNGETQWVNLFGALHNQRSRAIVQTPAGDIVTAGEFSFVMEIGSSISSLDPSDTDIFVARLNTDGSAVQAVDWGDGAEQLVHDIATDSGSHVIVGGEFQGTLSPLTISTNDTDGYVLRLEPDLSVDWRAQVLGNGSEKAVLGVAATDNHVYAVGRFDGMVLALDSAPMTTDAFVIAYDAESSNSFPSVAWSADFDGGSMGDVVRATAVAADGNGDAVVVGTYTGAPTFMGSTALSNAGTNQSIFVAKITSTGTLVWIQDFGSMASEQVATDVATDGNETVVVGHYQGDLGVNGIEPNSNAADIFVLRLDQDGVPLWGAAHPSAGTGRAQAVTIDASSNIILAGDFETDVTCGIMHECNGTGIDAFVFKLTREGERIWTYTAGSQDQDDTFWDVAVDGGGNVLLAGEVRGDLAGTGLNGTMNTPNAMGGLDILTARLSP